MEDKILKPVKENNKLLKNLTKEKNEPCENTQENENLDLGNITLQSSILQRVYLKLSPEDNENKQTILNALLLTNAAELATTEGNISRDLFEVSMRNAYYNFKNNYKINVLVENNIYIYGYLVECMEESTAQGRITNTIDYTFPQETIDKLTRLSSLSKKLIEQAKKI